MKCEEVVHPDNWTSRICGRPAKWSAVRWSGSPILLCGVHVRWYRKHGKGEPQALVASDRAGL